MTAIPTAGVVGWPVGHSRSPLIHKFWLRRHGIEGDYVRIAVPPEDAGAFFRTFVGSGLVGANVTIPHKQTAMATVSRATDTAGALGAVNTIWIEEGRLWGDNTDVGGFLASLDEAAPGWEAADAALVLGAGGAARAVVRALVERRVSRIHVLNRTRERAVRLAAEAGGSVSAGGLEEIAGNIGRVGLVVNATAAGLGGTAPLAIDWRHAAPEAIAADLVYVPLATAFLAGAADRGLRTVDGLGMLLHQAVSGFERWFGVRPRVDEALRRHVLADLGG